MFFEKFHKLKIIIFFVFRANNNADQANDLLKDIHDNDELNNVDSNVIKSLFSKLKHIIRIIFYWFFAFIFICLFSLFYLVFFCLFVDNNSFKNKKNPFTKESQKYFDILFFRFMITCSHFFFSNLKNRNIILSTIATLCFLGFFATCNQSQKLPFSLLFLVLFFFCSCFFDCKYSSALYKAPFLKELKNNIFVFVFVSFFSCLSFYFLGKITDKCLQNT